MPKTTNQPADAATLSVHACPKCAHSNALDARFCNACGIPLPVMSCPHCEAVNPIEAASCYQCQGNLQEIGANSPNAAAASIETHKPLPRPPIPVAFWVISAIILATLIFLGYRAVQMFTYADIPFERATLPAGNRSLDGLRGPSYSGTIDRAPSAVDVPAGQNDRSVVAPVMPIPAVPTPEAETAPKSAVRTPAESKRVNRPPQELCTKELAAVGLCSLGLERVQRAKISTKTETTITPPPPNVARKSTERAPAEAQPCTAGILALGLCKTESIQLRE